MRSILSVRRMAGAAPMCSARRNPSRAALTAYRFPCPLPEPAGRRLFAPSPPYCDGLIRMESFKSKGKGEIGAKTGYREIPPTSSGADRIDFLGGKNMRVLLVKPGEVPCIVEMDNTLEVLQDAVGGFIEAVYPFDDPIALICNENGKLDDLPLNRALRDEDGCIYDVIAGASGDRIG